MFALAAFIIAILAAFGVGGQTLMLWLWLAAIALHFAFGFWPNIPNRGTTP